MEGKGFLKTTRLYFNHFYFFSDDISPRAFGFHSHLVRAKPLGVVDWRQVSVEATLQVNRILLMVKKRNFRLSFLFCLQTWLFYRSSYNFSMFPADFRWMDLINFEDFLRQNSCKVFKLSVCSFEIYNVIRKFKNFTTTSSFKDF